MARHHVIKHIYLYIPKLVFKDPFEWKAASNLITLMKNLLLHSLVIFFSPSESNETVKEKAEARALMVRFPWSETSHWKPRWLIESRIKKTGSHPVISTVYESGVRWFDSHWDEQQNGYEGNTHSPEFKIDRKNSKSFNTVWKVICYKNVG